MALFFVSCAKKPLHIARGEIGWPSKRAAELFTSITNMSEVTSTLKALVQIEITDEEKILRTEAAIVLKRPGMLRFDAIDSLADVWAEAASDGNGLWLHLNSRKKLYKGKAVARNLQRLVKFDLDVPELISLITGVPPLSRDASIKQLGKRVENHFLSGGGKYHLWTKGALDYVSTFARYGDAEGEVYYVAFFNDYRRKNGIWFPHRIEISFPKRNTSVVIEYEDVTFGEEINSSLFAPPVKNDVRTIDLEKTDEED
jgi:outer membrane lipoprotein-sorting protein